MIGGVNDGVDATGAWKGRRSAMNDHGSLGQSPNGDIPQ